jgi:hypothetical protein
VKLASNEITRLQSQNIFSSSREQYHYKTLLIAWQHVMLGTAALLDISLFLDHGMHEKAYKQALLTSGG